jgi:hypothetical protein
MQAMMWLRIIVVHTIPIRRTADYLTLK